MHRERRVDRKEKQEDTPVEGHCRRRCRELEKRNGSGGMGPRRRRGHPLRVPWLSVSRGGKFSTGPMAVIFFQINLVEIARICWANNTAWE
jgi:hypothetical protein